jgi:hypothetical protein
MPWNDIGLSAQCAHSVVTVLGMAAQCQGQIPGRRQGISVARIRLLTMVPAV